MGVLFLKQVFPNNWDQTARACFGTQQLAGARPFITESAFSLPNGDWNPGQKSREFKRSSKRLEYFLSGTDLKSTTLISIQDGDFAIFSNQRITGGAMP